MNDELERLQKILHWNRRWGAEPCTIKRRDNTNKCLANILPYLVLLLELKQSDRDASDVSSYSGFPNQLSTGDGPSKHNGESGQGR